MRPTQQWVQWRPRSRPCRQAVPASPTAYARARVPPAPGKVTRLPRGELEEAGDQDDRTDRDGYGGAPAAGCCISTVARAMPSGKAAIPNTVHTKKYGHADQRGHPTERVSPVLPMAWR